MRLVPNRFKGGVPTNLPCVLKMKDQEWNGLTGLAVGVKKNRKFLRAVLTSSVVTGQNTKSSLLRNMKSS